MEEDLELLDDGSLYTWFDELVNAEAKAKTLGAEYPELIDGRYRVLNPIKVFPVRLS
jgi:hypothetical protein